MQGLDTRSPATLTNKQYRKAVQRSIHNLRKENQTLRNAIAQLRDDLYTIHTNDITFAVAITGFITAVVTSLAWYFATSMVN